MITLDFHVHMALKKKKKFAPTMQCGDSSNSSNLEEVYLVAHAKVTLTREMGIRTRGWMYTTTEAIIFAKLGVQIMEKSN